jgi:hypothetical protein
MIATSSAQLDALAYLLIDLNIGLVRNLYDQRKSLRHKLSCPTGLAPYHDVVPISIV